MKAALIFVLLITFSTFCYSQQKIDFFDLQLAKDDEKNIIKSINLMTKLIRREDWGSVYDLLLIDVEQKGTKAEFIQDEKAIVGPPYLSRKTVNFKAKNFTVFNNERFNENVHVSGCITVVESGIKRKYSGTVDLKRIGSEKWFFSSLPIVNPGSMAGGPRPC
jgi:hypothetical protein